MGQKEKKRKIKMKWKKEYSSQRSNFMYFTFKRWFIVSHGSHDIIGSVWFEPSKDISWMIIKEHWLEHFSKSKFYYSPYFFLSFSLRFWDIKWQIYAVHYYTTNINGLKQYINVTDCRIRTFYSAFLNACSQ